MCFSLWWTNAQNVHRAAGLVAETMTNNTWDVRFKISQSPGWPAYIGEFSGVVRISFLKETGRPTLKVNKVKIQFPEVLTLLFCSSWLACTDRATLSAIVCCVKKGGKDLKDRLLAIIERFHKWLLLHGNEARMLFIRPILVSNYQTDMI